MKDPPPEPGPLGGWLPAPLARRPLAFLLLVAATALLWRLGAYGLWESTEARYAEIAAAMVRSGDWAVPRLNGLVHLDKPPLAYWATAAGLLATGFEALGARLGLVLASLATLAIVYRCAEDRGGPTAGLAAGFALLTMPLYFALSRSVSTDLYLTLWVVLAVDAARRGTRPGGGRGWRILAWAALGAGFLTKGPVVLLWTGVPALAWAAAGSMGSAGPDRWRRLARLLDPWGAAAALAIALPWYLATAARWPGALEYWLGGQTAGRMAAAYEGEADPVWGYLPALAWGVGPWLVPAAAGLLARRASDDGRAAAGERSRADRRALLAAWVLAPLVLFSIFPTKRANYLLPALPALALAAGAWWAGADRPRTVLRATAAVLAGLGAGLAGASSAPAAAEIPAPLDALGLFLGPAFLLGAAAVWLAAGRDARGAALAGAALPMLGLYLALFTALSRPPVEAWAKISRPLAAAAIEHRRSAEPIVAWGDWPRAFPFYLGERIVTVGAGRRARVFEPDSAWREWIRPEAAIGETWNADRRVLVFLPRGRLDALEEAVGETPTVLATTRRWALVTNRPAAHPRAGATSRPPSGAAGSGPSSP